MKRFLLFVAVATLFAACSKDALDEQQGIQNIVDEAPATLTVGFEDDETRIQLNEAQKTVWTNGDLVSVFYRSDANQKWQYTGETGARTADLTRVDAGEATTTMNRVVVVYPYNENYYFNTETYNVQASLPATQTYLKDSYGLDGNIMVSSSEFNQFKLKTVYGWLKLQLTGSGEKIKSISLCGNNGEQVAGDVVINTPDATITLAADGDKSNATIFTEVTLDCGEGVELGAEATAFYIALPPQTFTKGLTVEITDTNGLVMTKFTDNEVVIERNHIKPMTAFGYNGVFKPANNEIYYTNGSATAPTAPATPAAFGSATIQSNTYDAEKECWVITFDKDVTEIGSYAFSSCDSLTSVTIGNSVTTIGCNPFLDCDNLKEFKGKFAADGGRCLIMDNTIIAYANASGTTYTIPDSVTTIGEEAFLYCTSLTSVTIPDSVTTIGNYAFGGCEGLASVTIGNSVTTIEFQAFAVCTSLTSVTIPDSVTTIGEQAFIGCESLTSVTIGNSVTTIGGSAFAGCNSLKEFKGKYAADGGRCLIIDGVLNAFAIGCGVTQYTIPDNVTKIGDDAFLGCTSLTSVTIPDSVTTIGERAFGWCSSLKTVYCKPTTPPTGGYHMFYLNASGRKIYVPASDDDSIIDAYKAKYRWIDYADYIFEEGPANNEIWYTTTDGAVAEFYFSVSNITPMPTQYYNEEQNCWVVKFDESCMIDGMPNPCGFALFTDSSNARITTLKFSENDRLFDFVVNGGGDWDPRSMTSLREINVPNYVTKLDTSEYSYTGVGTFQDCTSLETITLSNKLTVIGNNTFSNCSSLTSIIIPDSVTTIGGTAFDRCSSLKSVTLGEGLDNLKNFGVFMNCWSLEEIIIPSNITEIHKETFQNCDRLHTIYCKRETPPAYGYSNLAHVNIEKIYVPASDDDSIINAYKAAEGWSSYKDYIFEEE